MNTKRIIKVITGASAVALLASGCATNPDGSYAYQKTAIGTLGGLRSVRVSVRWSAGRRTGGAMRRLAV